jgi:hypothetical protein
LVKQRHDITMFPALSHTLRYERVFDIQNYLILLGFPFI